MPLAGTSPMLDGTAHCAYTALKVRCAKRHLPEPPGGGLRLVYGGDCREAAGVREEMEVLRTDVETTLAGTEKACQEMRDAALLSERRLRQALDRAELAEQRARLFEQRLTSDDSTARPRGWSGRDDPNENPLWDDGDSTRMSESGSEAGTPARCSLTPGGKNRNNPLFTSEDTPTEEEGAPSGRRTVQNILPALEQTVESTRGGDAEVEAVRAQLVAMEDAMEAGRKREQEERESTIAEVLAKARRAQDDAVQHAVAREKEEASRKLASAVADASALAKNAATRQVEEAVEEERRLGAAKLEALTDQLTRLETASAVGVGGPEPGALEPASPGEVQTEAAAKRATEEERAKWMARQQEMQAQHERAVVAAVAKERERVHQEAEVNCREAVERARTEAMTAEHTAARAEVDSAVSAALASAKERFMRDAGSAQQRAVDEAVARERERASAATEAAVAAAVESAVRCEQEAAANGLAKSLEHKQEASAVQVALETERDQARELVSVKEKEIEHAGHTIDSLMQEMEGLQGQVQRQHQELRKMRERQDKDAEKENGLGNGGPSDSVQFAKQIIIDGLMAEKVDLEKEVAAAKRRDGALQSQLEDLEAQLQVASGGELKEELKRLQRALGTVPERCTELEDQLAEANNVIGAERRRCAELESMVERSSVVGQEKDETAKLTEMADLKSRLQTASEAAASEVKAREVLEDEVSVLSGRLSEMSMLYAEAESERESLARQMRGR
ncbi:hypothetical protein CYMTET_32647 [Cymbomonas tetramitiformis]|uniref:Uncharacterized protein n=1 Tax=Cymbomonas tetramitiformis TaxID=36881 RepID=A0AAE0KRQ0_9CHLO|nr:hypothetical protein CYMTET_32647 [Cymbomonas tetramitiformis]